MYICSTLEDISSSWFTSICMSSNAFMVFISPEYCSLDISPVTYLSPLVATNADNLFDATLLNLFILDAENSFSRSL